MSNFLKSIENLINEFRKLPGIGPKSAKRIVYYLLKQPPHDIERFAQSMSDMIKNIKFCKICFNISEDDICNICSDKGRDCGKICIVEEVSDVSIIESTAEYRGLYHVLGNLLSPIDNIGPEEIKIPALLKRIKDSEIDEVIIALNPTVEGESTATYIRKILKPLEIKVTRLASGLPVGGVIEYADEITLGRALSDRKEF
ncbi:MAG: Recombination protein RecR [Actinobacteria bacterium ADurb.Bin346]|nr:MAG: Recombination protein RecR [Actinobacteria bacterium ADurb.Bin346]